MRSLTTADRMESRPANLRSIAKRSVRTDYALERSSKIGPLALKALRAKMAGQGLARSEVNRRVMLAWKIFKWAASEELIPFATYKRLTSVSALQKWRTIAPETESTG